jgi:hypothetical protein
MVQRVFIGLSAMFVETAASCRCVLRRHRIRRARDLGSE